jgi:Ca2+-binding EF-hand superfamily protein
MDALFDVFDRDRSGTIDYDEFLFAVRGELNDGRLKLVLQAYKKLDRDGNGVLDVNDIKGIYDASKHPDVLDGKKSED